MNNNNPSHSNNQDQTQIQDQNQNQKKPSIQKENALVLEKKLVSEKVIQELKEGMVLGVGSGSTVRLFVEKLANWIKENQAEITCVPTSYATEIMLRSFDLPVSSLWDHPEIDLTIDGADKLDSKGRMIKGLGGALFREKMVAFASKKVIILIDSSKWVDQVSPPWILPVEVSRFGYKLVEKKLFELGGIWSLRSDRVGNPFLTDDNNFILDGRFDKQLRSPSETLDVEKLDRMIKNIPGVIETGFFLNLCSKAYLAVQGRVEEIIFKK
ncbi:MAG: ribose 5-phosphate isomerase A [Candidatus Heimdallarchaeota archaeon]|nr:ribose 5-phosphate isomerase A [Candidatus Heimdallarchaeota archaeon]MCK5049489.1 ribose 5-phosphate isomerase A [Candidatus Heimdallarchaeota archaeon]